jgi:hypothetical protein
VNTTKLMAMVLIVAGVLSLAYGGFSYTRDTHQARIGPIEMTIQDKRRVNVPLWAGVVILLAGGALLTYGARGR